jgi:4-hydroxybenzoate polyprenyltransferase
LRSLPAERSNSEEAANTTTTTTTTAADRESLLMDKDALQVVQAIHRSWPLWMLPDFLKPYGELLRLHRPAGIAMFYFPCLYGTFLVGALAEAQSTEFLGRIAEENVKLLVLSFLLRGVLCTLNDIIDKEVDRQVQRTRIRPLARAAVSVRAALIFTALQVGVVGLCFQALFPRDCLSAALPFLALHIFYPFAKRLTHHPQFILGIAHMNGIFMSFPALGVPALKLTQLSPSSSSAVSLGMAILFWTLLNDTIYAAQDLTDDKKAGVGSTMIYWEHHARAFLRVLGLLTVVALLGISFVMTTMLSPARGVLYTAFTCGGTGLGLYLMVELVNLNDPASCGWWFNRGNVMVGVAIASGLIVECLASIHY